MGTLRDPSNDLYRLCPLCKAQVYWVQGNDEKWRLHSVKSEGIHALECMSNPYIRKMRRGKEGNKKASRKQRTVRTRT
jgi:hypothetical protein